MLAITYIGTTYVHADGYSSVNIPFGSVIGLDHNKKLFFFYNGKKIIYELDGHKCSFKIDLKNFFTLRNKRRRNEKRWTDYSPTINKNEIDFNWIYGIPNKIKKRLSGNAYNLLRGLNPSKRASDKKEAISNVKVRCKKVITLKQALLALNSCFTINKNVKKNAYNTYRVDCTSDYCSDYCDRCGGTGSHDRTDVNYDLRDREYKRKTKIVRSVIRAIHDNRLPIKYGKNDGIVYFEYLGEQVSFHDPKDQIQCKPFQGVWTGKPNKKIPFSFLTIL